MDFFRRVFNKSDSKPNLNSSTGSNGDDGLFGGLEVNDAEPDTHGSPNDQDGGFNQEAQNEYDFVSTNTVRLSVICAFLLTFSFFYCRNGSFTSEFSFISSPSPSITRNEPQDEQTPAPPTTSNSTVVEPSPVPKSPKTTKPKVKKSTSVEGTPKSTKPKASTKPTSPDGTPSDGTKRPKKRTLENRPGYGVTAEGQTQETSKTANSTSVDSNSSQHTISATEPSAIANDPLLTTETNTTDSGSYVPASLDAPQTEPTQQLDSSPQSAYPNAESEATASINKKSAPLSQADALKALQLDFDASVLDFRSRFNAVSERILASNTAKTAIYGRLGELELQKAQLRIDVKAAEEEEKYEGAAELNAKIDATDAQIDATTAQLHDITAEIEAFGKEKVDILKHFHALQLSHVACLAQLDLAQKGVIEHYDRTISELEGEANTVYASKIEMLNERLTDVEAELARSVEREQKIEAKIAANSQGLAESLEEDGVMIDSLMREVADLKAQLAAKEAALATVQSRRDANQQKMNALRKEQGAYLDDVVREKQKKDETAKTLRNERTVLEAQLARQHSAISEEKALQSFESDIQSSISEVSSEMSRMAEASLVSIEHFGRPLFALDSEDASLSSLESIQLNVSKAKSELHTTKEAIAMHNAAFKLNRSEHENARNSLPLLEQSKQAAVATRDYKEAARIKAEIANTQASLEALAEAGDALSKQVQDAQSSLISQQAELTTLVESLADEEAKHASGRMSALSRTKFAARLALRNLTLQPAELASLLHDSATSVSASQLEGMIESIEGEQKYLSLKFNLPIPEDESLPDSNTIPKETESESIAVEPEEEVNDSKEADEVEPVEPLPEPTTTEPEPTEPVTAEVVAIEDDSGLFDGLDEADPEETVEENTSYVPPLSTLPVAEDPRKKELEAQITSLEQQVGQAVEAEDYEQADELNNQLVAVQSQLSCIDI